MMLQQATNIKWYTVYLTAAIAMSLSVLISHFRLQAFSNGIFHTVVHQLTRFQLFHAVPLH